MTHLKDVGIAISSFFLGYIALIFMQEVITPLITAIIDTGTQGTTVASTIGGLGSLLIATIAMIIIPAIYAYKSYLEPTENQNVIETTSYAVLYTVIGFALLVATWFWVAELASVITETLYLVMFYAGLILTFINLLIIGPYVLLTKTN